jgi:hypothetical protein
MATRIHSIVFGVFGAVLGLLAAPASASDLPPEETGPVVASPPPADAARSADRAITVHGGLVSDNKMMRLLLTPWDSELEGDIPWLGLSASQRIWSLGDGLTFELEAGTGYRFGSEKTGEVWSALFVRYDNFPWNHRIHTTVAASTGVNLASRISPIEQGKGGEKTSKLLHYFSPEVTFADPRDKDLELVIRLHHRSGVFGLFDGASSGSNIATLGIRRHF